MGNCAANLCAGQKSGDSKSVDGLATSSSSSSRPGASTCGKVEAAVAAAFNGASCEKGGSDGAAHPTDCSAGEVHATAASKDCSAHSDSPSARACSSFQQERPSNVELIAAGKSRVSPPSPTAATALPPVAPSGGSRLTLAPCQQLEAMVPPVWALSQAVEGQPYNVLACGAPRIAYEASRMLTTQALKLAATDPSPEIDVILGVLNQVVGVSTSIVSLYGGPGGTMWISNSTAKPVLGLYEWEATLCPWMLLNPIPTMMIIDDCLQDARYSHAPLAQAIKSFATAPIIASNGQAFGSICALDFEKYFVMDVGQCRMMSNFAELATREFERHAEVAQRLKDKDELLHTAFAQPRQPMRRNLSSSYDSCIVIIDVSKGFEVVYVNMSWEQWSGGMSRDAVMGSKLPDVLESVTADPISWNQIAADAVSGQRFVISRVHVRNTNPEAASAVFDISFRCGALEALDNDTLPVVVPPYVKLTTGLGGIYFGRLHAVQQQTFTPLDATSHACPATMSPHDMAAAIIPGLKLKQGLGRGGFGTAYLAEWHDSQVVCKVQDHLLHSEVQRLQAEREISLGQGLDHPNIVRILAHATMQLSRHLPSNLVKSKRSDSSHRLVDFWIDDMDDFDWVDTFDDGASSMFESMIGSDPPVPGQWPSSASTRFGGADTPVGQWPTTASTVPAGGADTPARQSSSRVASNNRDYEPLLRDAWAGSKLGSAQNEAPFGPSLDTIISCVAELVTELDVEDDGQGFKTADGLCNQADAGLGGGDDDGQDFRTANGLCSQANAGLDDAVEGSEAGPQLLCSDAAAAAAVRAEDSVAAAAESLGGKTYDTQRLSLSQYNTRTTYDYPVELRVFLVMELCDKGCLQDAIDSGKFRERPHVTAPPVRSAVLRTALDIAEAVQYLHHNCIIHGDLTGYNILLKSIPSNAKLLGVPDEGPVVDACGRRCIVKIADFGTSRRVPNAEDYLRVDAYGTFTHMPPEMFASKSLGMACDVWALGVLLWSMWTGSRPWAGLSHDQTKAIVIENTATLQYPPTTPPAIAALGARCLAHNAADRPSIGAVCIELKNLLEES